MTTFSRAAIAMIGMTGLAAAQPKPADPKPVAKPADPKAGVTPSPKPPAELVDVAKVWVGTWKCKGQGLDHTMKMADMTATLKIKLDLDNWWLHGSFESRMGQEPFHFESFTAFDAATSKWKRVMIETGGEWANGESSGMKDNKTDWELAAHSPMGDVMFRDHEDLTDPKAGMKLHGELSLDKGKTWTPIYEVACKK